MKRKEILANDVWALIMTQEFSIDIDTEFDFKLAEIVLKNVIK